MMKILIIITLYFTTGPVDCSDVAGYLGGSVIIISNIQWYSHNSKYICKVKDNDCTDIIRADTKRHQIQDGRLKLYANTEHVFIILIRKLKPQDAGTYRFGVGNQTNSVNLKILNDPCCAGQKIKFAYLGQNITITCNYPEKYDSNYKYVLRMDDDSYIIRVLDTSTKFQNDRFSISDDKSVKVLSVNISDVREADEAFYLFGVWNKDDSGVKYYSYFTELWLHVSGMRATIQPTATTESNMMTSAALTETPSTVCFSPTVTISVCVCVAVLLIGGFGLMIYKLRHKRTQDYTASFMTEQNKPVNTYSNTNSANLYENFRMSPI